LTCPLARDAQPRADVRECQLGLTLKAEAQHEHRARPRGQPAEQALHLGGPAGAGERGLGTCVAGVGKDLLQVARPVLPHRVLERNLLARAQQHEIHLALAKARSARDLLAGGRAAEAGAQVPLGTPHPPQPLESPAGEPDQK
jgi:hypothetical protein